MGEGILILAIVGVIVLIAYFVLQSGPSQSTGANAEDTVAAIASKALAKGLYGYVLQNVYVPRQDSGTSEIDVLLLSTKGIFVFESKDFAGWIFGRGNQKNWTVTLYAGKDWFGFKHTEKHHFYNPVRQNQSHIKTLRYYLDTPAPMYSVVVFSNRSELKSISDIPENVEVLQTSDLPYYLRNVLESFSDVISEDKVDFMHAKLKQHVNVDIETEIEHLASIGKRVEAKKAEAVQEKCPWCKSKLVIRTAKRGPNPGKQFYGCSNYPNCTYTRNIE